MSYAQHMLGTYSNTHGLSFFSISIGHDGEFEFVHASCVPELPVKGKWEMIANDTIRLKAYKRDTTYSKVIISDPGEDQPSYIQVKVMASGLEKEVEESLETDRLSVNLYAGSDTLVFEADTSGRCDIPKNVVVDSIGIKGLEGMINHTIIPDSEGSKGILVLLDLVKLMSNHQVSSYESQLKDLTGVLRNDTLFVKYFRVPLIKQNVEGNHIDKQ
ncbi:MAG: hypothetical protein AAGI38_22510 [Bacteroidota bacterium]